MFLSLKSFISKNVFLLISLSAFLFFFHHLNQAGFFMDGLIYAALSKNMAMNNSWLVPHMSKTYYPVFYDHIPFMLILQGLFFKVFGVGFWQARCFVTLFTSALFFSVFYFLKKNAGIHRAIVGAFLFFLSLPLLKHGRHPNFDQPLALMVFLSIQFYINAIETQKLFDWMITGLFFGLAMLFKGPMAVFVPLTMLVHLLLTSQLKILLRWAPWMALLFSFFIFSLWPLSLFLSGHFDMFMKWFEFTFLASIMGSRGVVKNDYFIYLQHLAIFTPIHLLLFLIAPFKIMKEKKISNFYCVNLIFVLVVFLLTSSMKFKLSHYILCLYAPLIISAIYGVGEEFALVLKPFLVATMLIAGLVLFFMPIKKEQNRDYEIFEINKILLEKKLPVNSFQVFEGAYPYWSLAALVQFTSGLTTYENIDKNNWPAVLITRKADMGPVCQFIYNLKNYHSYAYYCGVNVSATKQ